jgi:hypothetical protein
LWILGDLSHSGDALSSIGVQKMLVAVMLTSVLLAFVGLLIGVAIGMLAAMGWVE